jgi:hypothetical protein
MVSCVGIVIYKFSKCLMWKYTFAFVIGSNLEKILNLYKIVKYARITTVALQDLMVQPPKIYWTDYTQNFQVKMKWSEVKWSEVKCSLVKLSLCMPWTIRG